jgi:hypothetical protein
MCPAPVIDCQTSLTRGVRRNAVRASGVAMRWRLSVKHENRSNLYTCFCTYLFCNYTVFSNKLSWNLLLTRTHDAYIDMTRPKLTQNRIKSVSILNLLTYLLTYLLTHLLTRRSRVLLEKLSGFKLVKKFTAFYKTLRCITAFTTARQPVPNLSHSPGPRLFCEHFVTKYVFTVSC